ncbi:ribosome small subunit-dependent GTPase A [Aureibacter tunicatorum]|uniref:Small ribosomal subunit biogenesis GTPase RsgA n=1 Tax=Aureibacter tunicatorum TaxID=866807 RepID=A0AAE3XKW0_9BACT|nr:ribosome small subunit-dependent GTPase A [Aureibacter tunicatorum]MDR6237863.1 ribosome biogenesis GTPase [Aureibacter tunicatorum]BDD02898.1 putative ribosome biogenesis GTPase RsgA 2 [Aureibacter tunicatorum]
MENQAYIYNFKNIMSSSGWSKEEIAQVIAVHKDRYEILTPDAEISAELAGNLRFSAQSSLDMPAVGDWVKIVPMNDDHAIILEIFKRKTILRRQSVGSSSNDQVIAANADSGIIAMSVGQDFNLRRIDRYLTICYDGDLEPIVLLTKTDLLEEQDVLKLSSQIQERHPQAQVISVSINKIETLHTLQNSMAKNRTYCFMGSSGVGKSTLINWLASNSLMKTSEISASHGKGRHTTTYRRLMYLQDGFAIVDTPGMREVGVTDGDRSIDATFEQIASLAEGCKYSNCTHTNEDGCAVSEAIENGELEEELLYSYQKLKREQNHYSQTVWEKRKSQKDFGKMIKRVQNQKKRFK